MSVQNVPSLKVSATDYIVSVYPNPGYGKLRLVCTDCNRMEDSSKMYAYRDRPGEFICRGCALCTVPGHRLVDLDIEVQERTRKNFGHWFV